MFTVARVEPRILFDVGINSNVDKGHFDNPLPSKRCILRDKELNFKRPIAPRPDKLTTHTMAQIDRLGKTFPTVSNDMSLDYICTASRKNPYCIAMQPYGRSKNEIFPYCLHDQPNAHITSRRAIRIRPVCVWCSHLFFSSRYEHFGFTACFAMLIRRTMSAKNPSSH